MEQLNGNWTFFYSEKQAEKAKEFAESEGFTHKKTYVEINNDLVEYTECIFDYEPMPPNYIPHKDRFDDSKLVAKALNPKIKMERIKNAKIS